MSRYVSPPLSSSKLLIEDFGLPKTPLVLALAEEIGEIRARRIEDKPWVTSLRTSDRAEEARRRARYKADGARLDAIGRFLTLPTQLGRYRLTAEQWFGLLEDQDGRCAICRTDLGPDRIPVVDHNHATGEVRGLLCGTCNTALGLFRDSPDVLDAALRYLEERGSYGPNTSENP